MKFFAKMSILDWCGVAYAAKQEPVSKIVSEMVKEEMALIKHDDFNWINVSSEVQL